MVLFSDVRFVLARRGLAGGERASELSFGTGRWFIDLRGVCLANIEKSELAGLSQ